MKKQTKIILIVGGAVVLLGTIGIISYSVYKSNQEKLKNYTPPAPVPASSPEEFKEKLTFWEKAQITAGLLKIVADAYGNYTTQKTVPPATTV